MAQYINKSAVVAEIKRYKHKADERLKIKGRTLAEDLKDSALQNLCGNLIHFLDTLEAKEINSTDVFIRKARKYFYKELPNFRSFMESGTAFIKNFESFIKGE